MTKEFSVGNIQVKWDEAAGRTFWGGAPAVTMWLESSIAGLLLGFQRMVGIERFKLALHGGGRDSVVGDWNLISSKPTFEEGFSLLSDVAASAGWGRWELVSADRVNRVACVRVHNSWEYVAQAAIGASWGSAYIGGKFAGIFQKYFDVPICWAQQTASQAAGDPHDEFLIKPSNESLEDKLEDMLASDQATKADLAVALEQLRQQMQERDQTEHKLRDKLEVIARQEEAIRALETPIIEVWEGVLTLPLIGVMDSHRAAATMERLLTAITQKGATTAILDLTGVEVIDTSTADHINKLAKASALLGTQCIITGIRPAVAQTMVGIGIDMNNVVTLATLREGLLRSMKSSASDKALLKR